MRAGRALLPLPGERAPSPVAGAGGEEPGGRRHPQAVCKERKEERVHPRRSGWSQTPLPTQEPPPPPSALLLFFPGVLRSLHDASLCVDASAPPPPPPGRRGDGGCPPPPRLPISTVGDEMRADAAGATRTGQRRGKTSASGGGGRTVAGRQLARHRRLGPRRKQGDDRSPRVCGGCRLPARVSNPRRAVEVGAPADRRPDLPAIDGVSCPVGGGGDVQEGREGASGGWSAWRMPGGQPRSRWHVQKRLDIKYI